MKNNIIMAVSELEDGREHIHCKNHKPEKYDLTNKHDLEILENYYRSYISEKVMCYSKDLTRIWKVEGTSKDTRVMVKSIRYEPYDENIYIPYRTFCFMIKK